MTKLRMILSRLFGYNIDEAEKEILEWHNSKQLTEGEMSDLLAKALYFKMGCHYEVDAKYYAKVLVNARKDKEAMGKK